MYFDFNIERGNVIYIFTLTQAESQSFESCVCLYMLIITPEVASQQKLILGQTYNNNNHNNNKNNNKTTTTTRGLLTGDKAVNSVDTVNSYKSPHRKMFS